jgi:hypothetical protein
VSTDAEDVTAVEPATDLTVRQRTRWMPRAVDAMALRYWLLSRIGIFVLVSAGAWLFADDRESRTPVSYLDRWTQWDTVHYTTIAHWGYDGQPGVGQLAPLEAFFPGYPLAIKGLHLVTGLGYVVAGLVISFVASAVAITALARIAEDEAKPGTVPAVLAERTVLLYVLAPSAVFLAAAYTEALFLAFAFPAWLCARKGRWAAAGVLAAFATGIRITGVFLAVALIVEFITARDGRRRWRSAPWLVVPFAPVVAYFTYLHDRTGDWNAWQHAQEKGWYRTFHWPWEALANTWDAAYDKQQSTIFAWMFGAEILAVAIGLLLTLWLLRERRWAEAIYIALQLWAFTTSYWFFSVPRSTLTWWPLWTLLAAWSLRRPIVLQAYLAVFAPFAVAFVLLFSNGRWAG